MNIKSHKFSDILIYLSLIKLNLITFYQQGKQKFAEFRTKFFKSVFNLDTSKLTF